MKKILLTAAALTLGTSAYAWMPMQDGGTKVEGVDKTGVEWDGDKAMTASADWTKTATDAWSEAKTGAKVETASVEAVVPKAFANWTDPTVQTAALDTGAKTASEDGDIQIAESEFKAKDAVDGSMMASADSGAKVASEGGDIQIAENEFKAKDAVDGTMTASTDTGGATATAMGGPFEAAADYPPCRPGPGDDRCIQLYERGVGQSLAMAKGAESNVAMGGPFEPVAGDTAKTETSDTDAASDGSAMKPDTDHMSHGGTAGSTTDDDTAAGGKTIDSGTATTNPGAIGGPVEQRTGYPPCRRGRGDDSCIQLYERGVANRRK
jgi:hypothetical protein